MSNEEPLVGIFVSKIDDIAWQYLAEQISSEFQFMDQSWYSSWESKYLPLEFSDSNMKYISIVDINNKLQGVYPCILTSKFGFKILSAAGFYYPFRMVLHSAKLTVSCAATFVETVNNEIKENIIRVGPTDTNQPVNNILESKFRDSGWMCHKINRGIQQIIILPDSVDEFKQSLSKNLYKNLKRRLKKLRELGEVSIEKFNNCSSDEWSHLIECCSDIERQSWLFSDVDGKTRIKGKEAFWKEYLESSDAQCRVNIWLVKLNGHPISFTFAIDSGPIRYSISGHYDSQYKKYGVGLLADYEMLQDSIRMGIKKVNLGDGDAEYKDRWGAKPESQLIDYIYIRPGILGHLLHLGIKIWEVTNSKH
jgi:hypothetical protein